jgi:hypothetical protein
MYDQVITIGVTNVVNEQSAPTDISISNSSVNENSVIGTTVGTFSSSADYLTDNTFTYTLVSGTGDTDNAAFTIASGILKSAAVFDYETKNSYTVRIRTTDAKSRTFEKAFTISINDLVEQGAPTDISLSASAIQENNAVGDTIGTLSTTAANISNPTFTYTLVSGTGSTDNASFTITGSTLKAAAVYDYETKTSYSVRVRTTDSQSRTFDKVFTISITDQVVEANNPTLNNFNGIWNSIGFNTDSLGTFAKPYTKTTWASVNFNIAGMEASAISAGTLRITGTMYSDYDITIYKKLAGGNTYTVVSQTQDLHSGDSGYMYTLDVTLSFGAGDTLRIGNVDNDYYNGGKAGVSDVVVPLKIWLQ